MAFEVNLSRSLELSYRKQIQEFFLKSGFTFSIHLYKKLDRKKCKKQRSGAFLYFAWQLLKTTLTITCFIIIKNKRRGLFKFSLMPLVNRSPSKIWETANFAD